jgi:CBS domain-containing protein
VFFLQPFITSLGFMNDNQLSGVGVVDERGTLIFNASSSDLKGWLARFQSSDIQEKIAALMMVTIPTVDFLVQTRQSVTDPQMEIRPVIFVEESWTIARALAILSASRLHRVFVCDSHQHPTRVISLADIIRFILDSINAQ